MNWVTPTDFYPCPICKCHRILIGYWNTNTQKAEKLLMRDGFEVGYKFSQRDKQGRLVVFEMGTAIANAHTLECGREFPAMPEERETKPYEKS